MTSYWSLFASFLKIGAFTIGGGYAMIPLIQREVVDRRGWIAKEDFVGLLTIAQSVPGPIALNSAAFVGYKSRGYLGALAALLGVVVPAFTVIFTVAIFFSTIRENEVVEAAFKALRPVVVALILTPTIALMKGLNPWLIGVTIAAMAVLYFHLASPAVLLLGAIIIGALWTFKIGKEVQR